MPGDPVPLDQFDKVARLIERQRRLRKLPVFRNEILRPAVQIRKIAPAAAGDKNLPPSLSPVLPQRHLSPSSPCTNPAAPAPRTITSNWRKSAAIATIQNSCRVRQCG